MNIKLILLICGLNLLVCSGLSQGKGIRPEYETLLDEMFLNYDDGQYSYMYNKGDYSYMFEEAVRVDTVMVYISRLEDVTKHFGLSFDDFVTQFMTFKEAYDTKDSISSSRVYLNYFVPLLYADPKRQKRVVTKEYTIEYDDGLAQLSKHNRADSMSGHGNSDYVLFCKGGDIDNFLKSPYLQRQYIGDIFTDIAHSAGAVKGLNLYFADFSFAEKRAMAQLVKSVSLAVDGSKVDNIRNLRLYLSFDKPSSQADRDYLCALATMVDSVFVFDNFRESGPFLVSDVYDSHSSSTLSFLPRLKNQLYMTRFYSERSLPVTSRAFAVEDIYRLMEADYPDNNWEYYCLAIALILLVLLVLFIFYKASAVVAYYVNNYIYVIYSLVVISLMEIFLLTVCMLEALSRDDLFSMESESRNMILIIPLVFMVLIPVVRSFTQKKELP